MDRLADKARIGFHATLDGVWRIVGEHGEECRVVHVGQVGLEAVPSDSGEIAAQGGASLDLGGVDEHVKLEARTPVRFDDHTTVLKPLEIEHLAPGQGVDLFRDHAFVELVEWVGNGDGKGNCLADRVRVRDDVVAHDVGRIRGQDLADLCLLPVRDVSRIKGSQGLAHQYPVISFSGILGIDLCRVDIDRKVDLGLHKGGRAGDNERGDEDAEQAHGEADGDEPVGLETTVGGIASAQASARVSGCPIAHTRLLPIYGLSVTHISLGICARCARRAR